MDPKLQDLTRLDPRYPYEAYEFVCDAVGFTQDALGRAPRESDDPDGDFHVSGDELARGACELAVQEFGLMAGVVFKLWGLRATDDIGNVVFNLIRGECLAKSDRDDPEDFADLFDVPEALNEGFDLKLAPTPRRGTSKGPR